MDTRDRASNSILIVSGLIALHVIDDNIVQPDWGGIGSHLFSAGVPLAALAGLVSLWPRCRDGARAAVTLVLGLIGLMVATESIYDLSSGTLSGDDWTGLFAGVGGLWLLVIGSIDLWRHRRRTGVWWRMVLRRTGRFIATVAALLFVAYPVIETYAVTNAADHTVPDPELGVPYEDVTFRSTDGLDLSGWFVPSQNGATVIVFPGRGRPQKHARMLIEHGYGVLIFDKRGTGASDGEPNGYGWDGQRDIHGAVQYLQGRDDVDPDRIGGIGLSVGGELMLQAAAEEPDGLSAVVSEGAGARSILELDHLAMDRLVAIPIFSAVTVAASVFTNGTPPPSLHGLSEQIEVPVFFIYSNQPHGGEGLSQDFYRRASGPKEVWEIDPLHVGGIDAQPTEYERRVVGFLDDALLQ